MSKIYQAVILLCSFFILVFSIAIVWYRHYPMLVIAGEGSVGTWMSGVLLTVSATISLLIGVRQGKMFWLFISSFFLLLACDERFMFHEQIKEKIIFSFGSTEGIYLWLAESPVLIGALGGVFVSYLLWMHLVGKSRVLLISAALFGSASVVIDVMSLSLFWEESFKLIGELCVTCALLFRADN